MRDVYDNLLVTVLYTAPERLLREVGSTILSVTMLIVLLRSFKELLAYNSSENPERLETLIINIGIALVIAGFIILIANLAVREAGKINQRLRKRQKGSFKFTAIHEVPYGTFLVSIQNRLSVIIMYGIFVLVLAFLTDRPLLFVGFFLILGMVFGGLSRLPQVEPFFRLVTRTPLRIRVTGLAVFLGLLTIIAAMLLTTNSAVPTEYILLLVMVPRRLSMAYSKHKALSLKLRQDLKHKINSARKTLDSKVG